MQDVLRNIEIAEKLCQSNKNVKIIAVVSGNESDKKSWQKRLTQIAPLLFNRDGSTQIISLLERIGTKTRQGNFLGTLLAYRYIKEILHKKNISYKDSVILLGMIFGRGERMSPITQAEGDRKSNIAVTPAVIPIDENTKTALCAIEEALLYFAPIAKFLENKGFRGILNKWGDETQIPALNLAKLGSSAISWPQNDDMATWPQNDGSFRYSEEPAKGGRRRISPDIVKFISRVRLDDISDDEARNKDWVIFNEAGTLLSQVARNRQGALSLCEDINNKLNELGINSDCVGISLGPVATSYDVLDIASEVFANEIEKQDVFFDYDPYFLMAIAGSFPKNDIGLENLLKMVPEFFKKVDKIKKMFKERHKRELKIKVFDFGNNAYWAEIGLHSSMRKKYLALNDTSMDGIIARKLAKISEERDSDNNIIVNSEISSHVVVKNSVIVNSRISGAGNIEGSVVLDSELKDIKMREAFSVKSARFGRTELKKRSGIYNSIGRDDIILCEGMRHVSVLTESSCHSEEARRADEESKNGKIDMKVSENTDLRDKENTYNVPIFGNRISFKEAYDMMYGVSMEELEARRIRSVEEMRDNPLSFPRKRESKPLRFGTSGIRGLVRDMTDMEVYINVKGYIRFLQDKAVTAPSCKNGKRIAVAGDLRSSTDRIMTAVFKAVQDEGYKVDFCGRVPSPALFLYAAARNMPSIMVTGSHIPDDRNGIKFTKASGEVLKEDEAEILKNVAVVREEDLPPSSYSEEPAKGGRRRISSQNDKCEHQIVNLPEAECEKIAISEYTNRYVEVFGASALKNKKIVFYQHSAVGRDIVLEILTKLGADVIPVERSDKFVPVDTEKISLKTLDLLKEKAKKHKPFAVISMDGDSDRPLLADENGEFLPGDKLGGLVALFLKPDFAAIPISANDAVVKALTEKEIKVKQTKIGSPYVIKAMNDELQSNPGSKVVSWESNGGFLLGSDWQINNRVLKALPTRDAVLPIIVVLVLAIQEHKSVSELIKAALPSRHTHADVIDNKTNGCEKYTPEMGMVIIGMFSAKEGIGIYFTKEEGFGNISYVNTIDGVRVVFTNNDVIHLRPSGNAPEFRIYATADTLQRAEEIVEKAKQIFPRIVADIR